ncbi:uncharacterized protein LOC142814586 isoform X3 [Rhipicephalus microplus]|uniref:uncharacterized protein LOC142814586 isoform X3 n=1 Tax=Rhipicephalus microplus TaxID=6941 RepID=UPI003F6C21E9
MLAFVKYEDKYKAILPITLVKAFKPKGEEDFEKNKKVQAYWRSEDGNIQGYYPAFVHALAGDLDTMRLKLKTLREPFPRTIDVDRHEVPPRKREESHTNRQLKRQRQEAANILQQSIIARSEEDDECQENGQPNEPPHAVVEELKKIIEKKDKEIKKLRKQLSEASSLNTRLTNVMLNKIEDAAATAERQEGQVIAEFMLPSSLDAGSGLPVEMVEDVRDLDMDVEATCLLPSSGVSNCNASIGHDDNHFVHSHDSLSHCDEQQQPAAAKPLASQARAMAPTDLYRVFDGQVKIGQNTFMALEKWEHIMRNTSDGKFCLELARHFWPTAEAAKRSLTGQACRSLSTSIMKVQATPEKVEMMEGCLKQFVAANKQPGKPEDVRVKAVRRYLRGFFTEAGRQGKRVRTFTKE